MNMKLLGAVVAGATLVASLVNGRNSFVTFNGRAEQRLDRMEKLVRIGDGEISDSTSST